MFRGGVRRRKEGRDAAVEEGGVPLGPLALDPQVFLSAGVLITLHFAGKPYMYPILKRFSKCWNNIVVTYNVQINPGTRIKEIFEDKELSLCNGGGVPSQPLRLLTQACLSASA